VVIKLNVVAENIGVTRTGGHCKGVIEKEVGKIEGVSTVAADPTTKDVVVITHTHTHRHKQGIRYTALAHST
jgi:hypothetical protein